MNRIGILRKAYNRCQTFIYGVKHTIILLLLYFLVYCVFRHFSKLLVANVVLYLVVDFSRSMACLVKNGFILFSLFLRVAAICFSNYSIKWCILFFIVIHSSDETRLALPFLVIRCYVIFNLYVYNLFPNIHCSSFTVNPNCTNARISLYKYHINQNSEDLF